MARGHPPDIAHQDITARDMLRPADANYLSKHKKGYSMLIPTNNSSGENFYNASFLLIAINVCTDQFRGSTNR